MMMLTIEIDNDDNNADNYDDNGDDIDHNNNNSNNLGTSIILLISNCPNSL